MGIFLIWLDYCYFTLYIRKAFGMILFADNVVSVVDDFAFEDSASEDSSFSEDLESKYSSVSEVLEAEDSSVPEYSASEDTSFSEDLVAEDSSVSVQHSANGETQQSVVPTIVNDIVVPDNSYSKYCFFFLMLLFALFVGRSFRKGV